MTPEHPIFRRASQLLHTMAWRWMNSHSDPQPPPTIIPPTPPSHNPNFLLPRRYVVDVFIQGGLNIFTIPYPPTTTPTPPKNYFGIIVNQPLSFLKTFDFGHNYIKSKKKYCLQCERERQVEILTFKR